MEAQRQREHAWATVARPSDLGAFLRAQRVAQEWTQDELAAELGITRQYLHEIEQGKPSLYTERLFAVLRELGLTLRIEADEVSALDVWLYGLRVATVTPASTGVDLTWSDDAVDRWGLGSRTVSQLLPIGVVDRTTALRAQVWLDGLLPEGGARSRLAADSRVDPDDTLAFLSVYGKDTAGGLVFVEEGSPDPSRVRHYEPVDDQQIAAMLRHAGSRSASAVDRSGLTSSSLAGMEPKIALARTPEGWARPLDGAPSTHIIKIARAEGSATADLVDTEAAALHLARMIRLGSVHADVVTFAGVRALVVSRYDRVVGEDHTERIHQEDLAQALGINTSDPDRKFQRAQRAMPSYRHAAQVLTDGLSSPDQLLALAAFTVIVGNTDGHAKNHSFLRLPDHGRVELAPAYDISMHEHTSVSSGALALKIAGKSAIAEITADDLVDEGRAWGMAPRRATRVVAGVVDAAREALDTIDRDAHPGVSSHAWDVVTTRARQLSTLTPVAPRPGRRGPRG